MIFVRAEAEKSIKNVVGSDYGAYEFEYYLSN
jgi:hypothetical protein